MEDKKIWKNSLELSRKQSNESRTKNSSGRDLCKSRSQGNLWVNSPCSMNFTNKLPCLERAERFQFNSIYHRDDPHRAARIINEFNKPDILVLQFRRNIKEVEKVTKSKEKELRKQMKFRKTFHKGLTQSLHTRSTVGPRGFQNLTYSDLCALDTDKTQPPPQNSKQKQIVERLFPKTPKLLRLQFDRYGNRSSFPVNENQPPKKLQRKTHKKHIFNPSKNCNKWKTCKNESFFTESSRLDMSRPENFNPGPGNYFQTNKNIPSKKRKQRASRSEHIIKSQTIKNIENIQNVQNLQNIENNIEESVDNTQDNDNILRSRINQNIVDNVIMDNTSSQNQQSSDEVIEDQQ